MNFGEILAAEKGLGGIWVRGDSHEIIERLVDTHALFRMPVNCDFSQLTEGLDLAATLASGRRVMQPGLIERARNGILVVPQADRIEADCAGALAAALDQKSVTVLLLGGDEVPDILTERVAFWVDGDAFEIPALSSNEIIDSDALLTRIGAISHAFGIDSVRVMNFAVRTVHALSEGGKMTEAHLAAAVQMVLVPRAVRWPETPQQNDAPESVAGDGASEMDGPLSDTVLEAVKAALPPGVLDAIRERGARCKSKGRGRGAKRRSPTRGRPVGVTAGMPRGGKRLALLDTLRAAAPWQKLRGVDIKAGDRIAIRKADLRVHRFKSRAETTTIFAVDASGSAAAARMAEAKGAVELLLAQAYVKRAQVALIAFRGEGAELLLPPTRSLTRARRLLGDMPGGGGTPIAAGLEAARMLAASERAKDRTPQIVILTDGRANVPGGGVAQAQAEAAAVAIARDGFGATLIDISARPRAEGQRLAEAMDGRYVALPRGGAVALKDAVG